MLFNDWLQTDFDYDANTISTFISSQQMDFLNQISRTCSLETISKEAEKQIFVHAGVDEEAGEYWMWGHPKIFLRR